MPKAASRQVACFKCRKIAGVRKVLWCKGVDCPRFCHTTCLKGETEWCCWEHFDQITPPVPTASHSGFYGCFECRGMNNERLLLCCESLGCERRYHTFCAEPPMPFVPTGSWYCPQHVNLYLGGAAKLLPVPGEKIMARLCTDLRWWPAVVVPSDAPYVPAMLVRHGGGALEGGVMRKKSKLKTAKIPSAAGTNIVAAYYGEPLGNGGEFTLLRMEWDHVKILDFNSPAFEDPTPALNMALRLAKEFDIVTDAQSLTYKRADPRTNLVSDDHQTQFLLRLMDSGMTVKSFAVRHDVDFSCVRRWLARSNQKVNKTSLAAVEAVLSFAAAPHPVHSDALVEHLAGFERRRSTTRRKGTKRGRSTVASSRGSTPRLVPQQRDSMSQGSSKHTAIDVDQLPSPQSGAGAPGGWLAYTWTRVGATLPIATLGFEESFGISPERHAMWLAGRLSGHHARYVEDVTRHVLGWYLGFDTLAQLEVASQE